MKRIVLALLIFLLLINSAAVCGAQFNDIAADAPYEKAIKVVCDLGIMEPRSGNSFEPKAEMSRAEFIKIVMSLEGYMPGGGAEQMFYDVPASSEYAGVISAAYSAGYISGYESTLFYPDRAITFAEMDSILIRVLGYDMQAERAGGYPYGYYQTAEAKKLHKGISVGMNNKVTRGETAQVLYNCLDVPMLELSVVSAGAAEYVQGETMSEKLLGVEKICGRMTGSSITSFDGKGGLGKNEIAVEFNTYRTDGSDYNELLGYSVEAYYLKNDNAEKIVSVVKGDKNTAVEIKAKDYSKYEDGAIFYNADNRQRKVKLSKRFYVIYNGEYYTAYDSDFWNSINGSVTLIDNDDNGEYDIVSVSNYEYYVVSRVDESDGIIYTKTKMLECKKFIDEETLYITDVKQNKTIGIGELAADCVISVMTGPEASMTIYANNPVISGALDGCDDDYITIDGARYEHCLSEVDMQIGSVITAYFNHLGEVVYLDDEGAVASEQYGYLLSVKLYEEDESVHLKMLTESGDRVIFDIADKVKIDGKQVKEDNVYQTLKECSMALGYGDTPSMFVKYKLNTNGAVNYIDTPFYRKESESDKSLVISKIVTAKTHYRCYDSKTNGNFEGTFNISRDAKVFFVPSTPEARARAVDEDILDVKNMTYFVTDNYYPVSGEQTMLEAYSFNNVYTTDAVVIYMDDNASGMGDIEPGWITRGSYMVVEKVKNVWDTQEEYMCWHIIGVSGGVKVDFAVKESLSEEFLKSLNPGDVVAYNVSFGKISTLKRVLNYEAQKVEFGSSAYTAQDGACFGELLSSDEDAFLIEDSAGNIKCFIHTGDISVFDTDENKASGAGFNDMVGREDTFASGRKALVLMKWGIVCSVILYK